MLRGALHQSSLLLRDDEAWAAPLNRGEVILNVRSAAALTLALTAAYGLGVGIFGPAHGVAGWRFQTVAATLKMPALTALIFLATCPAFLAAGAVGGLRLPAGATFRLCVATFTVFATVLGAFAPITGLVSLTCNYSFTTLINAAMIATAGLCAVAFLFRNVRRLALATSPGPRRLARPLIAFAAWSLLFALVGAEFGWRMRPLVGWRFETFHWFRTGGMTLWQGIQSEIHNILSSGGV